jgi:predicted dehydrogenase
MEKARNAAAYSGARAFTDAERMLAEVDCDVVAVATPDHAHTAPVLMALRAGKHVLVEKPLATSLEDGLLMLSEAEGRNLVLQVNYSQRYVPEYAWLKQQIDAGAIGRPAMVISSKQDTIFVPTRMIGWAASTSPIYFMSSHDIDLVGWFIGGSAHRVVATERRGTLTALGIEVHDGVDAVVEYDNNVTASFHSSWILPESYPTITVDRMTIMGDAGVLHFESRDRSVACYGTAGGQSITFSGPQTATEVQGRLLGAFRTSLETFVDAVRKGSEAATSARRTLHVLAVQSAILESARTGASTLLSGHYPIGTFVNTRNLPTIEQ